MKRTGWRRLLTPCAVLALAAGSIFYTLRREAPLGPVSEAKGGPAFELKVIVPRMGLPFAGLLPDFFVVQLDGTLREMGFTDTARGASAGRVGPDRLELRKEDGWDFTIESDGQGQITPATRLTFPVPLGGNIVKLRCVPADPPIGHFQTAVRKTGELDGRFRVELADCKNADTGEDIDWPPAPLEISGSFTGLAQR
jgi:hypothetical protein